MQVHRDIMDRHYTGHRAMPFAAQPGAALGVARGAGRGRRRSSKARASSTKARSSRPARASAPTASSAGSATSRSTRSLDNAIVWANSRISQEAVVRRSILGRHCHIGRNALVEDGVVLGDKSVVTDYSTATDIRDSSIPTSSRPTTSAASIPSEVNEDAARAIGARLRRLSRRRSASRVGRDMRLSSPSLAAAFIDGATSQGADVVDYGMMATDMLYFAVATRRARRRRADHRVAQPEAVQRHEDGPQGGVSAERRGRASRDIREMIAGGTHAAAGGAPRHGDDAATCSTPTSST